MLKRDPQFCASRWGVRHVRFAVVLNITRVLLKLPDVIQRYRKIVGKVSVDFPRFPQICHFRGFFSYLWLTHSKILSHAFADMAWSYLTQMMCHSLTIDTSAARGSSIYEAVCVGTCFAIYQYRSFSFLFP